MKHAASQQLIQRELRHFRDTLNARLPPEGPPDVRVVLRYLHARLFDAGLTVGQAVEACGIRSGQFPARFKRYCRTTLGRYVEEQRMIAAMRLLTFDALEVHSIALAVGYGSYRSFVRAFKRRLDCTPSTFRNAIAAEREPRGRATEGAAFRRFADRCATNSWRRGKQASF